MASYPQGYDEERFETTINRNLLCLICFNVLRNPVLCPRNQHHFCRDCITKFLENSQRCPTCADKLTVGTLTEPPRMVKDMLNELNIRCRYIDRGCHEIVQLQHVDRHECTCGFTPVVCTNQGCGVSVNKRDQIHHESELCEFRKLKCHSCGEMTKTLSDMEKKIEKVEATMEGKLDAVDNEVKGLKAALIEGFNEIKEVLVRMQDMKEENTRDAAGGASGDKENILVAGGFKTDTVEIFNWRQKSWSLLQSLPEKRWGATSFVYNNHASVAGGNRSSPGYLDNLIKRNCVTSSDLLMHWSEYPVKLPANLAMHSSVLYNDQLIVAGGTINGTITSDCIDEVQLVPPYAVKTLSRMPEPRQYHATELYDDNLLIVGGTKRYEWRENLSSVVLYDIKKNQCKQLAPLPYEVSAMATVRWGDNIVVIGGVDKHGKALDTVIIYNVKTEQHYMLPPMRCKRHRCTAVIIRRNIVVLGGMDDRGYNLKSVEAFNFDRYTWEELPEMLEKRWLHTAVVV